MGTKNLFIIFRLLTLVNTFTRSVWKMKHELMNFPSLLGRDVPAAVKEIQHSNPRAARREGCGEKV